MELSRRDWLKLGTAGSTAALLAGCSPVIQQVANRMPAEPPRPPKLDESPEVRLLKRAGFGPRPGDLDQVAELGRERWVGQQLGPRQEEDVVLRWQISRLDVFRLHPMEMRDMPIERVLNQLQTAAILRSTYSKNQLHERMVDFWTDHLNVYGRKGWAAYRKGFDETKTIRAHALGKFPAMIEASAKSPAMLAYLDNRFSKKIEPNENYARELLELHTLGVDGGYTHKDIDEVARCFTGWTIEDRFMRGQGNFRFDPDRHDDGEKIVLGQRIPAGGGIRDGERVLQIVTRHPATAQHIARKLCAYFLGDRADAWIDRTAKTFLKTDGDIAETIRPILLSDDLAKSGPILQRPFDYLVSALRVTGAQTDANLNLTGWLTQMGQPLYQWPMPDGYPQKVNAWTATLLPRWNFAFALAHGTIGGTRLPMDRLGEDPVRLAAIITGRPEPSRELAEAVLGQDPRTAIALCLASPEFQWR